MIHHSTYTLSPRSCPICSAYDNNSHRSDASNRHPRAEADTSLSDNTHPGNRRTSDRDDPSQLQDRSELCLYVSAQLIRRRENSPTLVC